MPLANCANMDVNPYVAWKGNIHGFVLDGKIYRPRLVTAQTSAETVVSGVRDTMSCATLPLSRVVGGAPTPIGIDIEPLLLRN